MGYEKTRRVAGVEWPQQDLNLRPTDYESAALTAELWGLAAESGVQSYKISRQLQRELLVELHLYLNFTGLCGVVVTGIVRAALELQV